MNWIKSFVALLNRLFGVTARHNRALRNAKDWAETVSQFLAAHNVGDTVDMNKLLEKGGDIKFELTTLTYSGRDLMGRAGNLKNKQAEALIGEMVDNLERIRRYMFSPDLQKERLRQALIKLRTSVAELQKNLGEM